MSFQLAEFQRKRKKKKTHLPKDAEEGEPDTRTLLRTQTALYAAYDRIEELGESLAGKQLALDKFISENDRLQRKIHESKVNRP
uniref:Uncharacterized protein n=1 Tax=Magallana gigas TaxID=29159 RepID=A0A8W8MAK3_MAGGI